MISYSIMIFLSIISFKSSSCLDFEADWYAFLPCNVSVDLLILCLALENGIINE